MTILSNPPPTRSHPKTAIVSCHLFHQGHGLRGDPWFGRSCPRYVLTKEFEALAMPPQQRLWLNDDEGLFPVPHHSCQQDQEHPVRLGTRRPHHLSTQAVPFFKLSCDFSTT